MNPSASHSTPLHLSPLPGRSLSPDPLPSRSPHPERGAADRRRGGWGAILILALTAWGLTLRAAEFTCTVADTPLDVVPKFELWLPDGVAQSTQVRGLILVSDYEAGTDIYLSERWRELATQLGFGMLRHKLFRKQPRFKPDEATPCGDPAAVAALTRGLETLAGQSGISALNRAPLVITGLSAAGRQTVELAGRLAERTICAVPYHTRRFAGFAAAHAVPMMFPMADHDQLATPLTVALGIGEARVVGALWAGLYQPGTDHPELGSEDFLCAWVRELVDLRLAAPGTAPDASVNAFGLRALREEDGWIGTLELDQQSHRLRAQEPRGKIAAFASGGNSRAFGFWLSSEATARRWLAESTRPYVSPHDQRPLTALGAPDRPAPLPRARHPISIDGTLDEWQDIAPMAAPFSGLAAASSRLCWSEAGLYGAVTAQSAAPRGLAEAPWRADAFEVFLDRDFARATTTSDRTAQWLIAPERQPGPAIVWPASAKPAIEAACQPRADGYTLEFFIPAALVGTAPLRAGVVLGFNSVLYRKGEPLEMFFCTPRLGGHGNPSLWGALTLAP